MTRTLVARYLKQRPALMVMVTGWYFISNLADESTTALAALVAGMALFAPLVVPSGVSAFTCSLPIRGRDLVMSRVLAMIAVPVIPTVVWVAMDLASGQVPAALLMREAQVIALVAALGVAAVVAWVHYTVPDALPIPVNGRDARKHEPERKSGAGTDAAWWSVIRAALPPGYLLYCAALFGAAVMGIATPLYCVILLFLPAMIRRRREWLPALPVWDGQRLRLIMLPRVVVFVACIEVGRVLQLSVLKRQEQLAGDWRAWLIDAAVLMVVGVIVVLLTEVDGVLSRRLRGPFGLLLRELATLPVAAIIAADIVMRLRSTDGIVAYTTRTLHDTAASSVVHAASVLVLTATLLVTMYALLEHQFRRYGTSGNAGAQAA